ncbi:MAG: helix-turn-helix domain-containing protein [Bacilli bacterium]|nr:helix-turn-helix domain-containing protein [Bacilli bacterium]
MDNNKVGKFIAMLRREKGLTQQELGDRLFVTDKAVSKWERGLSFPDITILERLASELDVDVLEILCGERGKSKGVNVQEEIDNAIARIEEDRKIKKEQSRRKVSKIVIISLISLVILFLFAVIRYKYYHPSVIREGNNHYEIGLFGRYNLEENGLDEFIKIFDKTEEQNKLKSNIVGLNIDLNKKGNIKTITLSVAKFDDELNYVGNGYYVYKDRNLEYHYESINDCQSFTDCEINRSLVVEYSKSLNINYLSERIKKIPFRDQIKLSDLKYYKVSINPNEKFSELTRVFDMRDNRRVKALSFDDYKSGKGGVVSSGIYLEITLGDGSSTISSEVYRYIFDNVDGDIKKVDYSMETDYYIDGKGRLLFTRDYGNSWIEADISPDEVRETLSFYRGILLQNSSWFISTNELVPIAYFYGENPKLKISTDNGITWNSKVFDLMGDNIYKDVTSRIVGFTNQNFGYVAMGTDWTMGSGEIKKAYLTENSGKDWKSIELPENGTSKTLVDFIMYDEKNGIVLLNNNQKKEFPYMYSTKDGGMSWEKTEYMHEVPNEIVYISNIDSIEKNNNVYSITLSQGDFATTKVKLESIDLINWTYDKTFKSNIHTVG